MSADQIGLDEFTEKQKEDETAQRCGRHYDTSLLPVFKEGTPEPERRDTLLALYAEVCNSWRMLTDVRFKLLGIIPTISVVVLISLLSRQEASQGLTPMARLAISIFGFLITIGLYIYDRRNSELYNDLVSRGRRIEKELGMDTGQFLGRRNPSNPFVNHGNAVNLIYGTALAGWLFAALAIALGWTG
jgi:hypothetical protein